MFQSGGWGVPALSADYVSSAILHESCRALVTESGMEDGDHDGDQSAAMSMVMSGGSA